MFALRSSYRNRAVKKKKKFGWFDQSAAMFLNM